jgi:hypothetical protein
MSGDRPDDAQGHVFISYVRDDREQVRRLQGILEDAGIKVWLDTADIWPGQDWRLEIRKAILAGSLVFMACFSENSERRESSYQNEELILAVEQMRLRRLGQPWLIPVRFAECPIPPFDLGAGRMLDSLQHIDLFDGSWEQAIPRLIGAVHRILGGLPAPGSAAYSPSSLDDTRLASASTAIPADAHPGRAAGRQESALRQRATAALDQARHVAAGINWESRAAAALSEIATVISPVAPSLAEEIVTDIKDAYCKALALADIAEAVAALDPRRGAAIAGQAEKAALSIEDQGRRSVAFVRITKVIPLVNRDRAAAIANEAERATRTTSVGLTLANTLIEVAHAVGTTDRNRAADIAERAARAVADIADEAKAETLAEAAKIIAVNNPDRAQTFAESFTLAPKWMLLTGVAAAVAVTDPYRAEQIAAGIDDSYYRALALAEIARIVGAIDRNRATAIARQAEHVIEDCPDGYFKPKAQIKIARALATADPGLAEQFARNIDGGKTEALAEVAKVIAVTDADLAERIATSINDNSYRAVALAEIARTVSAVDRNRAAALAIQADKAAVGIYNETQKERTLASIAGLLAVTAPDRAEEIAATITSESRKANAMAEIAGAVAVADPHRAERIAAAITEPSDKVRALAHMARSWLDAG